MLVRNFTPFPPLQFESRDEKQQEFGVVVLRGTFEIRNEAPLRPAPEQEPLVLADDYFGEPGKSSLRFESSLAPYKPRTDVLFTAKAYAPGGRPTGVWETEVAFGPLRKRLRITGPRYWKRGAGGWSLTRPEPISSLPVRYEYAYGGTDEAGGEIVRHEANPVGLGFVSSDRTDPVPAPQIVPADQADPVYRKPFPVEGLGPIAPGWSPRRERAGTFDAIWEKSRWPDLPEDFSFSFYNTAPPGLTMPGFAAGFERAELLNLTPDGRLSFTLPAFELATLLRFANGSLVPGPVFLDTIHIDCERLRAYMTWRGVFPLHPPIRVVEVRIRQRSPRETGAA